MKNLTTTTNEKQKQGKMNQITTINFERLKISYNG